MFISEIASAPVKSYFSSSKTADLTEIRKAIEKQIITNVLAPLLLAQKSSLQSNYDTLFTDVAADQIDSSMKGQFSKKVVSVIDNSSTKFEEI